MTGSELFLKQFTSNLLNYTGRKTYLSVLTDTMTVRSIKTSIPFNYDDVIKKVGEMKKVIDSGKIKYIKEKALTITANGESLKLCIDGEITIQKKVEFSMVEDAVRFIVPAKIAGK